MLGSSKCVIVCMIVTWDNFPPQVEILLSCQGKCGMAMRCRGTEAAEQRLDPQQPNIKLPSPLLF